jgi:hypothetical protein
MDVTHALFKKDWKLRQSPPAQRPLRALSMWTPPKGDVTSVPLNGEGRKLASWGLAADNAAGNQCRAFGVGGIMRQPVRLRIRWDDDRRLTIETDLGQQTRQIRFGVAPPPAVERQWQAVSTAPGDHRQAANRRSLCH